MWGSRETEKQGVSSKGKCNLGQLCYLLCFCHLLCKMRVLEAYLHAHMNDTIERES